MGVFSCYEYAVETGGQRQFWYLSPEIGFVRISKGVEDMLLRDYIIK